MSHNAETGPFRFVRAMHNGFRRRCPKCGRGPIFQGYLALRPACDNCGTETGEIYTADVAPYFTILVVGHIVVPLLLLSEQSAAPPMWLQFTLWPSLALLLTFWFLPRIKGCIMGFMWVLGMRGHEHQ